MTEEQLQSTCATWFWNEFPEERLCWHHNDNNSWNAVIGAKKKALGVVKGVWDFEWLTPADVLVWIEFKVGKNVLTEKQIEFREKMIKRGCLCFIVYDEVEQFKKLIWQIIGS